MADDGLEGEVVREARIREGKRSMAVPPRIFAAASRPRAIWMRDGMMEYGSNGELGVGRLARKWVKLSKSHDIGARSVRLEISRGHVLLSSWNFRLGR